MGFGFLTGNSIGPLLDLVISVEPQVVVTALIGTAVVFVSLSASALLAERGSFLFIGGIAMSIFSTMALFGLANIFIQSQMIYQVNNKLQFPLLELPYKSNAISIWKYVILWFVADSIIRWPHCYGWFCLVWYSNDHGTMPSWFNRLHPTLIGLVLRFGFNVPSFAHHSHSKGKKRPDCSSSIRFNSIVNEF